MLLRDQSVAVLLCERDHADGNWEDLLKATARLPAPPNLIVFSRLADESLWAKVLNLGGFDVLITPFEPEEVLRAPSSPGADGNATLVRAPLKKRLVWNPAAVKAAPPEEGLAPGATGNKNAIVGGRSRTGCMNLQ